MQAGVVGPGDRCCGRGPPRLVSPGPLHASEQQSTTSFRNPRNSCGSGACSYLSAEGDPTLLRGGIALAGRTPVCFAIDRARAARARSRLPHGLPGLPHALAVAMLYIPSIIRGIKKKNKEDREGEKMMKTSPYPAPS